MINLSVYMQIRMSDELYVPICKGPDQKKLSSASLGGSMRAGRGRMHASEGREHGKELYAPGSDTRSHTERQWM